MAYIRILNTSIRKANKKAKRDLDLYQIQEKTLYEFNYLVRRIEVFFEMKLYDVPRVVSEADSVQAMIERESKKNKNQWPADWVDTIMAPLRNGIAGIAGDAASQQPNPSVDQSQSSNQPNAASQPNGQLASATNPSVADSTPPPQLQALRPGYSFNTTYWGPPKRLAIVTAYQERRRRDPSFLEAETHICLLCVLSFKSIFFHSLDTNTEPITIANQAPIVGPFNFKE